MVSQPTTEFTPKNIRSLLRTFFPASKNAISNPRLILEGAERFPHALGELCEMFREKPVLTPIKKFNTELKISRVLRERFTHYKTDKAEHNYHLIYGEILSCLGVENPLNILEIGLGTIDETKISHMNSKFSPGASLRSFRDVAINSQVYGADIDEAILFTEDRIQTARVDQMQPKSFVEMNEQFENAQYDLIIDDGLHSVAANLNTLLFALTVLKPGGWVVIEDIWNGQICWDVIYQLIPAEQFNCHLIAFDTEKRVFILESRTN